MWDREDLMWVIVIIVIVLFALCAGAFTIYVNITYGNLPITEIPSWALKWVVGK